MPADGPTLTEERNVAPRQCGRCRQVFPGDPDLPPDAIADWWICQPCREALFGR